MAILPISIMNYKKNNQNTNPKSNSFQYSSLKGLDTDSVSFTGASAKGLFKSVAMTKSNPRWDMVIARGLKLSKKIGDKRNPFERDIDRIVFSDAFNREAGKTQVYANLSSEILNGKFDLNMALNQDSTRMSHSFQEARLGRSWARDFGLNEDLTEASILVHDAGHTPMGHAGEDHFTYLMRKNITNSPYWKGPDGQIKFWHGKNGLRIMDDIETKPDVKGHQQNLGLTYGTLDGMICHSGKFQNTGLKPREDYIDLSTIQKSGQVMPFTWEGILNKVADDVTYVGKDVDDGVNKNFLSLSKKKELHEMFQDITETKIKHLNNSAVVHYFSNDFKINSNPQEGMRFSDKAFNALRMVREFNDKNIYSIKDKYQNPVTHLIFDTIYNNLEGQYGGKLTLLKLKDASKNRPKLTEHFRHWLVKHSDVALAERKQMGYQNKIVYFIDDKDSYKESIIGFMSSLTDKVTEEYCREIMPLPEILNKLGY